MIKELQKFAENLQGFKGSAVGSFPDIDLYMDQVVTCLEKMLGGFDYELCEDRLVTPNMINNYVKEGYISRPVNKKYNRDQLIRLFLLLQLKPVMPISLLAIAINEESENTKIEDLYERYKETQERSFSDIGKRLLDNCKIDASDKNAIRLLALQLTSEANALRIAAEKLLEKEKSSYEDVSEGKK